MRLEDIAVMPSVKHQGDSILKHRTSVVWLVAGLVLSFAIASAMLSGWEGLARPNVDHPFVYAGDGLSHLWFTQRVIEGWVFANGRSGFPFGSSFLDYPGSDAGNLLILKLLGFLSGRYYAAANLYYLLSFPVAFASTFLVCRRLAMRNDTAFACALLFSLLPFHFFRLRMGHLFYSWYFTVPIYFYIGYRCLEFPTQQMLWRRRLGLVALLIALSSFGVYFAFFGLIIIGSFALISLSLHRHWKALARPIWVSAAICLGVAINVLPNAINTWNRGVNPEVAQRLPFETEVYALKLTHLLMPHPMHRIQALREFSANYVSAFPLSNTVSYVGIVGIAGLALILINLLRMTVNRPVEPLQRVVAVLTIVVLLIATVGGLNVFFALLVSPTIRGWDRIGIFVGFLALLATFLKADQAISLKRLGSGTAGGVLCLILIIGIWDQTPPFGSNEAVSGHARFDMDRVFIGRIEGSLPRGAAVYQMPYISFPESGPLHSMHSYDQLVGFLNSKELRWSAGGMAGRPGDLFYRELSTKPLAVQLETARALGFSGIYIDKHGYADGGAETIKSLSQLLGKAPTLTRTDDEAAFFSLL